MKCQFVDIALRSRAMLAEAFLELFPGVCCQEKKNKKDLFFPPSIAHDPWVKHYFIIWWALFTKNTEYIHFCFISINPTLRSFSRVIMSLNNILSQSVHLALRGQMTDFFWTDSEWITAFAPGVNYGNVTFFHVNVDIVQSSGKATDLFRPCFLLLGYTIELILPERSRSGCLKRQKRTKWH